MARHKSIQGEIACKGLSFPYGCAGPGRRPRRSLMSARRLGVFWQTAGNYAARSALMFGARHSGDALTHNGSHAMSNSENPENKDTQADHARRALEMKQEAEGKAVQHHPESRTAGEGQVKEARPDEPPMGALDAEGHRAVLERSRKVR